MGCGGGVEDTCILETRGCPSAPPVDSSPGRSCPLCSMPAHSLGTDSDPRASAAPGPREPPHSRRQCPCGFRPAPEMLNQFCTSPPWPHPHTPPECSPRSLEERWGRPGESPPGQGCCFIKHILSRRPGGPDSGDDGLCSSSGAFCKVVNR